MELIWRSASCPRHWNQRWFGDAAFTIPSGKQWDHMSPWAPSWLSAGIDECCRSANESGHHWLKNSWLDTRSVKWTVVQHFQLSAVVRLSECRKKTQFLFTEEKTFWLPMTCRSGCWSCRSGYFRFMLDRQHEPKGHGKCCKYSKSLRSPQNGFAVGFCGDRRPSCHVFHTSRQAMIKTYITCLQNCARYTLEGRSLTFFLCPAVVS